MYGRVSGYDAGQVNEGRLRKVDERRARSIKQLRVGEGQSE
jgi:hypothetical protein